MLSGDYFFYKDVSLAPQSTKIHDIQCKDMRDMNNLDGQDGALLKEIRSREVLIHTSVCSPQSEGNLDISALSPIITTKFGFGVLDTRVSIGVVEEEDP